VFKPQTGAFLTFLFKSSSKHLFIFEVLSLFNLMLIKILTVDPFYLITWFLPVVPTLCEIISDLCFQDPFGEKRGSYDYEMILKRLESIKTVLAEKQTTQEDSDSSDTDLDTSVSER